MPDEERIKQLELENKVLQKNNKGLKAKIDELQKEIEELKSINQGKTEALEEWINGERVSIHCVHKNKIKEKIEELEKGNKNTFIRGEKILVLQSLLEKGYYI